MEIQGASKPEGALKASSGLKVFFQGGNGGNGQLMIKQINDYGECASWQRLSRGPWQLVAGPHNCSTFVNRRAAAAALNLTEEDLEEYDKRSSQKALIDGIEDVSVAQAAAASPGSSQGIAKPFLQAPKSPYKRMRNGQVASEQQAAGQSSQGGPAVCSPSLEQERPTATDLWSPQGALSFEQQSPTGALLPYGSTQYHNSSAQHGFLAGYLQQQQQQEHPAAQPGWQGSWYMQAQQQQQQPMSQPVARHRRFQELDPMQMDVEDGCHGGHHPMSHALGSTPQGLPAFGASCNPFGGFPCGPGAFNQSSFDPSASGGRPSEPSLPNPTTSRFQQQHAPWHNKPGEPPAYWESQQLPRTNAASALGREHHGPPSMRAALAGDRYMTGQDSQHGYTPRESVPADARDIPDESHLLESANPSIDLELSALRNDLTASLERLQQLQHRQQQQLQQQQRRQPQQEQQQSMLWKKRQAQAEQQRRQQQQEQQRRQQQQEQQQYMLLGEGAQYRSPEAARQRGQHQREQLHSGGYAPGRALGYAGTPPESQRRVAGQHPADKHGTHHAGSAGHGRRRGTNRDGSSGGHGQGHSDRGAADDRGRSAGGGGGGGAAAGGGGGGGDDDGDPSDGDGGNNGGPLDDDPDDHDAPNDEDADDEDDIDFLFANHNKDEANPTGNRQPRQQAAADAAAAHHASQGLGGLDLHGPDPGQGHGASGQRGQVAMRRRGSSRPLDDHKQHQAGQRHHAHASGGQDGPSAGADAQHDDRQNGTGTGTQPRSRAKKILVVSTTIGSTEDLGAPPPRPVPADSASHVQWQPTVPRQLAFKPPETDTLAAKAVSLNPKLRLPAGEAMQLSAPDLLPLLEGQRVHLLCLRQSSTDLTSPATLKCMTKWGPLGEGGQGSVSWAQLHRCELPAALNICSGYRGAVKVVKTAQFAWLDGKGVPGVVRKAAAEFESQLRAGQDAMYSLKPCSMGAIMFAVDFTDGILPQAAIDLADGTEADAVAAAYAVAHNHAVDPAGASQLGLDKPDASQRQLCLVFAYVELPLMDSCLYSVLKGRPKGVDKQEVLAVAFGCSQGIDDFGAAGLVHRDIKSLNLLQSRHKWALQSPFDFKKLPLFASFFVVADPLADPRSMVKELTAQVGSRFYFAPEVLAGSTYNHKVDVWCFGVLMLQCRFGLDQVGQWKDQGQLASAAGALQLDNGRRPAAGSTAPQDIHLLDEEEAEMLRGCLDPNPVTRWGIQQLMSCRYIARARSLMRLLKRDQERDVWLREWYQRTHYLYAIYPEGHGQQ